MADASQNVQDSAVYAPVLNNVELTSLIFQYLKDITYQEAGLANRDDQMPDFPAPWTHFFARLALVSRTFFHASIAVLWEKMDSLYPFFYVLLPADGDPDGGLCNPPGYAANLITAEHWRRFALYTSQTRVLVLKRPDVEPMSNGWLLHLALSKSRPDPLFAQLNQLIITSDDNLSLFVAHSSAPHAKSVTINFDGHSDEATEEPGASLAASICANIHKAGGRLTRVSLLSPRDSQYALRNICSTPSLDTLQAHIGPPPNEIDFESIAGCRTLKGLSLDQILPPEDVTAGDPGLWPTNLKVQDHVACEGNLPDLRALRISTNALTQFLAAQKIRPRKLTHLTLSVNLDDFDEQVLLLPLVLAIHAGRNPSLGHLELVCDDREIAPESVAARRHEWLYMDFKPLFANLRSLQDLTVFKIVKIPFLCADIVDRLVDIALELPRLQSLTVSPRPISTMAGDDLIHPPLSRLEEISRKNTHLVALELLVDFAEIPAIPKGHFSVTRLQTLKINQLSEYPLALDGFSTDELLSLGRYLDKVFPNLKSLTTGWGEEPVAWELWEYVEKLVHSFQDLRAEARRELEAFTKTQIDA